MSVDAVIVHFRGGESLARCLYACRRINRLSRVIVVDNEGTAGTLRHRYAGDRLTVLEMPRNLGYASAVNRGLAHSDGDAVLVLNQDVQISSSTLEIMLEAGTKSGAWLVGPRLIDLSGREVAEKKRFPAPLAWSRPAENGSGYRYVPWIAGAALLFMPGYADLRFDERFFMYVEDEELCWRVWESGGSVVLATDARAAHEGASAATRMWSHRQIVGRVIANRAKMVMWHKGWRGTLRYLVSLARAGT